jgi:hypothetical protein
MTVAAKLVTLAWILLSLSRTEAQTTGTVVSIDAQQDRHPISPLIHGMAFASTNQLRDLNCLLNRSGGNAESRYNWQLNAHNRAGDWYFESLADSSASPGAVADDFVAGTRSANADVMLTVPTLGWAPKLGPKRGRLASYSIAKYGAQADADHQWFPDAGNGVRATDGKAITWNDRYRCFCPLKALPCWLFLRPKKPTSKRARSIPTARWISALPALRDPIA